MTKELLKVNEFVPGKYNQEEEKALKAFVKFVENNPDIKGEFVQTPYGTFFDVAALNKTGGTCLVELKFREETASTMPDCFIEPEKWSNLITAWREYNNMPLYINFMGSWKDVYVWFLPYIKTAPVFHYNVKIKTDDGKYMIADRLGLAWNNAWHYVWDEATGKYIKTPPVFKKDIKEVAVPCKDNKNERTKPLFKWAAQLPKQD